MKKLLSILLLLLVLSLSACKEKTTTYEKAGMQITIGASYAEQEVFGYTAVYRSTDAAIFCLKETYSDLNVSSSYSIESYTNIVLKNNNLNVEAQYDGDTARFEFNKDVNGSDYHYYAYVTKSSDAFWLIQFGTLESSFEKLKPTFDEYIHSITFVQA